MKLTAAEIDARKTANGGWTKGTLAEWGVPWPPAKGWKTALILGRIQLDPPHRLVVNPAGKAAFRDICAKPDDGSAA